MWLGIIRIFTGFGQSAIFAALFHGPRPVLGPLMMGRAIFLLIGGVVVSFAGLTKARIENGFANLERSFPG